MKRVLFVSENVTLAQVVRLVVLADALDPDRYEVHFACSEFESFIFDAKPFHRHELSSVSREQMDQALHSGARLYDAATLESYLADELALFDRVRPDFVVGDFRWTLTVSCPLRQIPHAALINAYWSPHRVDRSVPLPEHPIVRRLGVPIARIGFPLAMPFVFKWFTHPLNRLRKRHGLAPFSGLVELLTHGDYVLYPDIAELAQVKRLPPHHRLIGPVLWEPAVDSSDVESALTGRERAYVTLGSSGDVRVLSEVVEGLEALDLDLMIATAGRVEFPSSPRRMVRRFLPGSLAAQRARLVVTNGGASTGYQALAAARPVLGLPFNIDQYLAMAAMERTGAARQLRSGTVTAPEVTRVAGEMLGDPEIARHTDALARALTEVDCRREFRALVNEVLG